MIAAPACPASASPLHVVLWPHLRHPTCNGLEDLDLELTECDDFTSDQLKKLAGRKIFQNDSQREEFLKVKTIILSYMNDVGVNDDCN